MRAAAAGTRLAPRANDSSTALVKSRSEVSLSTTNTLFGRRGLTLDEVGSASRNSSNVSSGQLSPVKSPTRSRHRASTLQLEAEATWPMLSESRERGSSLGRMVAEDFRLPISPIQRLSDSESNRTFFEASDVRKARNVGIDRLREVEVSSTTSPSNGKRPSTGQLPKLAAAGMLQLNISSRDSIGSSLSTYSGTSQSLSSQSPSSSPLHQATISPKAFGLKRMASRPWLSNGFGQKVLEEFTLPRSPSKSLKRLEEGQKIFDLYYWEDVLQEEGDGGKVVICRPKEAPKDAEFPYVLKIRSKESLRKHEHEEAWVRTQLRMLNFEPRVGIISVKELFEDDTFYYVLMDKAEGGSFFDSLLTEFEDGVMPHNAVQKIVKEILEALSHLHSEGILHRDIKPDNLVMQLHEDVQSPSGKVNKVTIIDFDHADTDFDSSVDNGANHHCYGTARFNAPESFLGNYSAASDLYSVGAILYMLISGSMPYPDEFFEDIQECTSPAANRRWTEAIYERMRFHTVDWRNTVWTESVPASCKDFCQKLLAFNPKERFSSAEEALAHCWFMDSGN